MVEELRAIGAVVHLAEPAETSALRAPKKRAKTDRQDARRLRELLQADRVPESWIPSEQILELRSKVRLRHTLIQERGEWQQRIQAQLYHHGSSAAAACWWASGAPGSRRWSCPTPPAARSGWPWP
jgi:transposase